MATGPEHYREAERIVSLVDEGRIGHDVANSLAKAQIHATLALAAATALATTGVGEADLGEWSALICEPEPTDDEAGDESRFSRAQLDGEACTECGVEFAEGEPTVPSGVDFIEGQVFAHRACAEAYDEPMTNRDVDPEHVAECDAYADAYSDTPIESGS